jgi:hypothetical protein
MVSVLCKHLQPRSLTSDAAEVTTNEILAHSPTTANRMNLKYTLFSKYLRHLDWVQNNILTNTLEGKLELRADVQLLITLY